MCSHIYTCIYSYFLVRPALHRYLELFVHVLHLQTLELLLAHLNEASIAVNTPAILVPSSSFNLQPILCPSTWPLEEPQRFLYLGPLVSALYFSLPTPPPLLKITLGLHSKDMNLAPYNTQDGKAWWQATLKRSPLGPTPPVAKELCRFRCSRSPHWCCWSL